MQRRMAERDTGYVWEAGGVKVTSGLMWDAGAVGTNSHLDSGLCITGGPH